MATKLFGTSVPRREDARLLRGQGRYLGDIQLPSLAHVALLRSRHPNAVIKSVGLANAQAVPGVLDVFTHADLGAAGRSFPLLLPHEGLEARTWCALAEGRVRFVGEPVAAVVAETEYAALAGVEALSVEYELLEPVLAVEDALRPETPLVHADIRSNLAIQLVQRSGNAEAAMAGAPHRLRERIRVRRGGGMPLEPRGVVAQVDENTGELTVWSSTQEPHTVRDTIAVVLGIAPSRVRVIAPDTGGGFGTKLNVYPEEVLIPWIAMQLRRPIRWVEVRSEHMLTAAQERDQVHDVEVGFDEAGRISALHNKLIHDMGAYAPRGAAVPHNTSSAIPGPYRIENLLLEVTCVYTNKVTVSAYRGAGQPQGVFIIERVIDWIAEHLGNDPAEVRMRNFIPADSFPYDTGITNLLGGRVEYDSGNFEGTLQLALEKASYASLREWQRDMRAADKFIGIGIATYVELTGRGPWEGAGVTVEPDGRITVFTGAPSQGQGHETTMAQICSDQLGVPIDIITVKGGDTSLIPHGIGTFASRVGVLAGNAVRAAALEVKQKVLIAAEDLLEASAADIDLQDGYLQIKGVPERRLSLSQVAATIRVNSKLDPVKTALQSTCYFQGPKMTYSNGTHIAVVEVDVETGLTEIMSYFVAHDCGNLINPMVVEGQIEGGLACGIGNALLEQHVYNSDGQLVTGSFMDYAMPRATDMPELAITHQECASTLNPLGLKGAGEAGTIPVPAAVCSAIEDALRGLGVRIREAPLTSSRLWEIITEARSFALTDSLPSVR